MRTLLLINNVMAVDTFEGFGQVIVAAVAIDQSLDLGNAELLVGEDHQVGTEGAKDAVLSERDNAIVAFLHRAREIIDVLLGLYER